MLIYDHELNFRLDLWLTPGAAGGCGWQIAVINVGGYLVVAIRSVVLLAFFFHVGGMELWMGIIYGLSVRAVVLIIINLHTNYNDRCELQITSSISLNV